MLIFLARISSRPASTCSLNPWADAVLAITKTPARTIQSLLMLRILNG
jgi:hypothetical protein